MALTNSEKFLFVPYRSQERERCDKGLETWAVKCHPRLQRPLKECGFYARRFREP